MATEHVWERISIDNRAVVALVFIFLVGEGVVFAWSSLALFGGGVCGGAAGGNAYFCEIFVQGGAPPMPHPRHLRHKPTHPSAHGDPRPISPSTFFCEGFSRAPGERREEDDGGWEDASANSGMEIARDLFASAHARE